MSYNAVGQITTGYRQPPGPGGVFDAFGQPGGVNLAEWKISACSWQKFVGVLDKSFDGPCARRDLSPVEFGEERADRWVAEQCAEGKLVYASPPYSDRRGGEQIDLYASSEPLPVGFKSGPSFTPSMVQHTCAPGAGGCPPGMVELADGGCQIEGASAPVPREKTEEMARTMMVGGVVVAGVLIAGVYFFTRKR